MAENKEQNSEEPKKGFITSPSAEDLKPSPDEVNLIKMLHEAGEAAAKSQRVLGEPQQIQTFLSTPTPEQLQFSPREQALLRALVTWNEQSNISMGYIEYDHSIPPSYSA